MAARRPVNLSRRQAVYYFRGFIPKALHARAQRREVRVSLRTTDPALARARSRPIALAFDSLCRQLWSMQQLDAPDQDILEAVQSFGRALIKYAAPPPAVSGPDADYELDRMQFWLLEEIGALERAIATRDYEPHPIDIDNPLRFTRRYAELIAAKRFESGLSTERFDLLRAGIARAQLEERRHFQRRVAGPFAALDIADPLFRSPEPAAVGSTKPAPTFADAVDLYKKAKAGVVWTPRTEAENGRILRLATEHFGNQTPISAITLDNVRAFRDSVIAWRKKPSPTASLMEISDAPIGSRISAKSAAKYFGYVSAAFTHWTNEGYLDKSPAGKLTIHVPHQTQASARVPFGPSDLNALFSSPLFTGCAGPQRRTKPGEHVIRDGLCWALLIAPLSGLRITEIVQLALDDIDFSDEVPAFRIKADVSLGQSVKSDAGWRRVPVHRRLIELGFKDFVTGRQTSRKSGRLLHDIHISNTGGSGGELSKLFGRILHRLDLKRPGLVFHSFRHGFVDALREANAPEYVIKRIVGHASSSVTDGYGSGASLKTCRGWIDRIAVMDALPPNSGPDAGAH